MQKRKGFTLVELVIVIAVIAILAGVLIGTFASVINKANESAKMQEMKAAEHDQKANDILEKLNNAQWFGWEDLETKIGEAVQSSVSVAVATALKESGKTDLQLEATLKTAVAEAVDTAIAKYAVAQGQDNTQLTAEQVQYIVEQAVSKSGSVTEPQVKAIINSALQGVSTLNSIQVQKIVDAATTKVIAAGLTSGDLAAALANVANDSDVQDILNKIEAATKGTSTLTADEVAAIVSKYVNDKTGVAKGDFTWYEPNVAALIITGSKAEEQLVALATLSASGETFEGKTITIDKLLENVGSISGTANSAAVVTLDEKWNPIRTFSGKLIGNGVTIKNINMDIIYYGADANGATAYEGMNSSNTWYGEKKGYGFIDLLKNGEVEGLNLVYDMTWSEDPGCKYTYFGGVAGAVVGTSTIKDCNVSGDIKAWGRTGGIVGYIPGAFNGNKAIIDNCSVQGTIITKMAKFNSDGVTALTNQCYAAARKMIGWLGSKDDSVYATAEIKTGWSGTATCEQLNEYNYTLTNPCAGNDIGYAKSSQVTVGEGLTKTPGGSGDGIYVNITVSE